MAKKHGIGPNTGKRAYTYQAIAPDGSILVKKTYIINQDEALIAAFEHNGNWIGSGVITKEMTEDRDWGSQIFLTAYKIK